MSNIVEILKDGAKVYGVDINEENINKFLLYKDILKDWNQKINLTAIEDDEGIVVKHFIDSLTISPLLPTEKANIIDVGTGAGFPGIPLKITRDNLEVTLLDSLDKRIKFLNEVISSLKLTGIKSIHGRAEDFGVNKDYREKYDIATARAVAALPVLAEYCLPFVKVGGLFIAMKGSSTDEIGQSEKALKILGGEIQEIKEIILHGTDMKRNVVIIKKLRQTPTKYPRKAGKPTKEPLI